MRIVVKVGTSTLAHSTGRLNIRHTEDLVKVLSDLKNAGHEVILRRYRHGRRQAFAACTPKGYHHQAGLRRCGPV